MRNPLRTTIKPGIIRASFSFYNTKEEIDRMIEALNAAIRMLQQIVSLNGYDKQEIQQETSMNSVFLKIGRSAMNT